MTNEQVIRAFVQSPLNAAISTKTVSCWNSRLYSYNKVIAWVNIATREFNCISADEARVSKTTMRHWSLLQKVLRETQAHTAA